MKLFSSTSNSTSKITAGRKECLHLYVNLVQDYDFKGQKKNLYVVIRFYNKELQTTTIFLSYQTNQYRPNTQFSIFPPAFKHLLIINALVFLALNTPVIGQFLYRFGALWPIGSGRFGFWQLISYMFLDVGFWNCYKKMDSELSQIMQPVVVGLNTVAFPPVCGSPA